MSARWRCTRPKTGSLEATVEFDLDLPAGQAGHRRKPRWAILGHGYSPRTDRRVLQPERRDSRRDPSGAHPAGRAGFRGLLDHEQAALDLSRRAGGSFIPGNGARKTVRAGRLERMGGATPPRDSPPSAGRWPGHEAANAMLSTYTM